ncbi:Acyl-CoA N-acyltransferase [Metarhizium rileyi]|uniref:Acyl-CoA N-acyltransferase n=1 Tax=Metarhizium rileyi (strain RCEF 4871) TaxID=1649241 RepID=A0A166Y817_METRR|nr:Acyl-CoA N-acyltransferase [Metarhizium rileyi RCEF 4871]TWU71942.1 hypothetical protein ED733_003727 [Metarhizium rileyi]
MSLPVGPLVSSREAIHPRHVSLHGETTSLVPLEPSHATGLFKHLGGPENHARWTYMLTNGFPTLADCQADIDHWSRDTSSDRLYYTVLSGPASRASSEPVGMMCYLAIVPCHRRLEIGSVILGAALQRTRQATEAFYLLLRHAFEDLGYLRVEWKANSLNQASLRAAERLGFVFEGVFRKHVIVKGRERDTAWFSITDVEWEQCVRRGFERWLRDDNFDSSGRQKRGLKECREA